MTAEIAKALNWLADQPRTKHPVRELILHFERQGMKPKAARNKAKIAMELKKKYVWDGWQKVADFIQDSGELGELGQDKSQVALDGLRELLELRKTKSSPWISVKERMPTREEADESGDVVVTDGEGWWIHGIQHSFSANATHWMPFIPPPQPSAEEKMREEFEEWYATHDPRTPQSPFEKEVSWAAWQAARKSL